MAQSKKVKAVVKLNIPAGKANPAPPVGPALGQHGVPIMDFCNQFNSQTKDLGDVIVPVVLTVYEDRSFSFITKTPPASSLLLKKVKKEKGSSHPSRDKIGKVSRKDLEEIAKIKMEDLNAKTLDAAVKIIEGTARNMGIEVE